MDFLRGRCFLRSRYSAADLQDAVGAFVVNAVSVDGRSNNNGFVCGRALFPLCSSSVRHDCVANAACETTEEADDEGSGFRIELRAREVVYIALAEMGLKTEDLD